MSRNESKTYVSKIAIQIAAMGLFLSATLAAAAARSDCQMAMLDGALAVYKSNWNKFSRHASIEQISFGVEAKELRPYVLFEGSNGIRARVIFKKPEPILGCPKYEFAELKID